MKHVFPNREVFHIFFHRQEGQDYAEGGGNCSWRDNICYSYSSELGYADFENRIFYFRGGSRSNSTSKHQNYLLSAIPDDEWYTVSIDWWDWERSWDKPPSLNKWINSQLQSYLDDKKKLVTGTKYFGNPLAYGPSISKVGEVLSACGQTELYQPFLNKMIENRWTQEELKIHEVKTWCLENGITGSYETKLKVYNNPELAKDVIEKNRIRKEHLEATKEERRLKAIQKNIEKWYNGEVRDINFGSKRRNHWLSNNSVYLRIKPSDNKMVQTSKGVEVPLVECAMLYRKFKQCRDTNTTWHQNGDKFRIGYYQVETINWEKSYITDQITWYIKAGCHKILDAQIEEFVNRFTNWNKNEVN